MAYPSGFADLTLYGYDPRARQAIEEALRAQQAVGSQQQQQVGQNQQQLMQGLDKFMNSEGVSSLFGGSASASASPASFGAFQSAGGFGGGGTGAYSLAEPSMFGANGFGSFSAGGGFGGAGGAGGAGGGAAGLINPWTALAAAIVGNEANAMHEGYRDSNPWGYAKDIATTKVLEQDLNNRFPDWMGMDKLSDDKTGLVGDAQIAGELSTLDLGNAWDKLVNDSSFSKILDLFR